MVVHVKGTQGTSRAGWGSNRTTSGGQAVQRRNMMLRL